MKQSALEKAIAELDGEIAVLQHARQKLIEQRPKPKPAPKKKPEAAA